MVDWCVIVSLSLMDILEDEGKEKRDKKIRTTKKVTISGTLSN